MKSGRLLGMLLLLQARGRMCARELARQLEVSQRTVYRDLDALSAAGVPVHAERGVAGGIVLADGYRRALTQFSDDELRGLFISGDNPLTDIGLTDKRPVALEKIVGALPETQRRAVEMVRDRVYVDQRRWRQSTQPRECLAALRVAVWENRRVRLHYKDQDRKHSIRIIDPLGLVAKAGVWYLVARYGDEMRTFRAERIVRVEEVEDRFARPEGFDLVAFWRDWTKKFEESLPSYPVLLRVPVAELENLTAYWESEALESAPRSQTLLVKVIFPSAEVAVHQIVAWANKVDIIEPQELRERVVSSALDVLARYGKGSEGRQ